MAARNGLWLKLDVGEAAGGQEAEFSANKKIFILCVK